MVQGGPLLCSGSKGIQLDGPLDLVAYRQVSNCGSSYAINVLMSAKEALNNKHVGKSIQVLLQQDLLNIPPLCSFDGISLKATSSQRKFTVAVQTQTSMQLQGMHIRAFDTCLHFHQQCYL